MFFKWIKQNLWIKAFFGTSANAVKTQFWITITMYVLAAIMKKRLNLKAPLSKILLIFAFDLSNELLCRKHFMKTMREKWKSILINPCHCLTFNATLLG